jgi:arylsulfatase A-like enzyme
MNDQLMYVTDWYATFCKLAGVDPTDDWVDAASDRVLLTRAGVCFARGMIGGARVLLSQHSDGY